MPLPIQVLRLEIFTITIFNAFLQLSSHNHL
jgi:hypothetical protein